MIFNVSQLLREPTGATRRFTVDEWVNVPLEGNPAAHIAGPVELIRTPTGLLARADVTGSVPGTCGRCVQPAVIPLRLHIEEEYYPRVDPVTGAHLPDPADPGAFRIDESHHLDLSDAVRQAVVLAEPMQVLCREDCRGLCPQCGTDLNARACACEQPAADERWGVLRGLDVQ